MSSIALDGFHFGFAAIDESTEPDPSVLHEDERERLKEQKSLRRRAEYVAGRLAAKSALAQLVPGLRASSVRVLAAPNGAPRVVGGDGLSISISHGKTTAVAVASAKFSSIGIDLCDHSDAERIRRVGVRSFALTDRALALASDRHAITSWAIKESIAKSFSMGMLEGGAIRRVLIRSIDPPVATINGDNRAFDLRVFAHADGVIAVSWLL